MSLRSYVAFVLLAAGLLFSLNASAQRSEGSQRPARTLPIFAIDSTAHAGTASRIVATPDERHLVTVSHDKTLRIWDAESGQLVRRLIIPVREAVDGEMMALALSPDGQYAAVGGYLRAFGGQKAVVILSLQDGSIRHYLNGFSSVVWSLAWSPDGRFLAVGLDDEGEGGRNVRIFETSQWQPVFDDASAEGRTAALGFRRDNMLFATTHNPPRASSIRLFKPRGSGFVLALAKSTGGQGGQRAYWSSDEKHVYVQGHGYYDGDDLSEPRHPSRGKGQRGKPMRMMGMRESPDGRHLYGLAIDQHASKGNIWRWSLPVSTGVEEFALPDPRPMDFVVLKNGVLAYVSDVGVVAAVDPEMKMKWRNERRVAAVVNRPESLRVSSDGNWVSLPVERDGRRSELAFNLAEPRFASPDKLPVKWKAPETSRTSMRILSWEGTREPSVNNVRFPMRRERERSLSVAVHASEDAFVFGSSSFYLRKANAKGEALWSRYLQANVSAVQIIEAKNLVLAATANGYLHLLRWSDGKPVLSYYLEPGAGKWIALSSQGYYEAGIGAEDLAGWIVNRNLDRVADFFPLSRFRARFLLPGLAAAAWATGDQDEALKQLLARRQLARADGKAANEDEAIAAKQAAQQAEVARKAEAERLLAEQQAEAARRVQEQLQLAEKQAVQQAEAARIARAEIEARRQQEQREQREQREQLEQREKARQQAEQEQEAQQQAADLARQQAAARLALEEKNRAEESARNEALQRAERDRQQQLAAASAELERLSALAAAATLAAQQAAQVAPALEKLPPVVDILSPGFDVALAEKALIVRYKLNTPDGAPVLQVRGRVIAGSQVARSLISGAQDGAAQEIRFELPPEDAEIQIVAENRWGASVPATIRVRWQGPVAKGGRMKGVLHVVAVGVSEYDNPDYRLDFAAKDARDFAHELGKQDGGLYSTVKLHLLTDRAAAKAGIEAAFAGLRSEVSAKDTTMVFLAGHGINDAAGEYLYLPREASLDHLRETGVSFRDLGNLLASLPGRTVMFVDTCHSGNVVSKLATGQSQNNAAAVNELASSDKNIIVFASSTGDQASLEFATWGNGAFTKALLEGFGGKADFLKRGRITYKQLDAYVADRVDELTDGKQTPVTPVLVTVPDFTLAEVKK